MAKGEPGGLACNGALMGMCESSAWGSGAPCVPPSPAWVRFKPPLCPQEPCRGQSAGDRGGVRGPEAARQIRDRAGKGLRSAGILQCVAIRRPLCWSPEPGVSQSMLPVSAVSALCPSSTLIGICSVTQVAFVPRGLLKGFLPSGAEEMVPELGKQQLRQTLLCSLPTAVPVLRALLSCCSVTLSLV